MDKEHFLSSGLLEQYVLGLTTPEETREVERYLQAYPELQAEVNMMRQAINQYAVKQSIPLSRHNRKSSASTATTERSRNDGNGLHQPSPTGAVRRGAGLTRWLPLVTSVIFALLAFWLFRQLQHSDYQYRQLTASYALFREQCEEETQKLQEKSHLYAALMDPEAQPVYLQGTPLAPATAGVVYWNKTDRSALFQALNLPAPPPGHQYQIWADVNGKMINLGLLEESFSEIQPLQFIEQAESLNVTIEPSGGSAEPTVSQLVLNGRVS